MSRYVNQPCSYYLTDEAIELRLTALVKRIHSSIGPDGVFPTTSNYWRVPKSIRAIVDTTRSD